MTKRLTLSEFEKSDYPNHPGVRRFDKIVRFLTIGPVKAGWLTKEKGIWSITDAGEKAFNEFQDPASLHAESGRLYRAWKKEQPSDEDTELEDRPDSTTLEEAEETRTPGSVGTLGEQSHGGTRPTDALAALF